MKHVLSMLLLLTALPAFAQKAAVERVASDPLNIAASKYPMTDLNGHTAPLVIVEVLTDNVEFKGNVLDGGVGQANTGCTWVSAQRFYAYSPAPMAAPSISPPTNGRLYRIPPVPPTSPSASVLLTPTIPSSLSSTTKMLPRE